MYSQLRQIYTYLQVKTITNICYMTPQDANAKLKTGDHKLIADTTGFHIEYVGQILRGEHPVLESNEIIVDVAIAIIKTREAELFRVNRIAKKLIS